ncbi:MAG: hypothetical protein M1818_001670 [Claussenomyces sp. TS43310]|nr:MAG: hypothetical protein M1818_001670 [Claussenomyces sp. TS43310]
MDEQISRITQPKKGISSRSAPSNVTSQTNSSLSSSSSVLKPLSKKLSTVFRSLFPQSLSPSSSPPPPKPNMVNPFFVILPLYIYPTPGAWDNFYSNITANPALTFSIVINPSSGPGTGSTPDSNYIAGISHLNSFSNTELYGYVHTTEATRSVSAMEADIKKYAGWASYASADIHMDGIFFDEAPSTYTKTKYTTMQTVTQYANTTVSPPLKNIIYNPGVVPDSRYYALATTINAFEDYYSNWSPSSYSTVPAQYRAQSTMLIHDFTDNLSQQNAVVQNVIAQGGWQGLYINNQSDYSDMSDLWASFCADMTSA